MKKSITALIAVLVAVLLLAGCDTIQGFLGGDTGSGVKDGAPGDTMKTYFFDFTVDAVERAHSHAGYTPGEGFDLVVVTITTTNTFDEALPMVDYDYQLQWGERNADDDHFSIVLDALDEKGAPGYIDLPVGESMTYEYVYEVPAEAKGFDICYLEEFIDNTTNSESEGDIHYVALGI